MLAILNKIPAHYPKAWVMGILIWCAAAVVMGVAVLFLLAGWQAAYFAAFGLLGLLMLGFMGCIAWFFVQSIFGRVTPWRQ
jgi:hypothetical protein